MQELDIKKLDSKSLNNYDFTKSLKRLTPETYLLEDNTSDKKN